MLILRSMQAQCRHNAGIYGRRRYPTKTRPRVFERIPLPLWLKDSVAILAHGSRSWLKDSVAICLTDSVAILAQGQHGMGTRQHGMGLCDGVSGDIASSNTQPPHTHTEDPDVPNPDVR